MTAFGYFLSSEEFTPRELLDQARTAGDAVVRDDAPGDHVTASDAYRRAGFDEVHVGRIGSDQDQFFDFHFHRTAVLPALRNGQGGAGA